MSTHPQFTFHTDFFKPIAGEDEQTNPGRYGKALAEWLAERLRERGVSVEGVFPEDFGWVVVMSRKPFVLWLGCGNTEGNVAEWSVFTGTDIPMLQRLFKRVNPAAEIEKLRRHLAELLPSIPGVTNITFT